jgi:protein phosphatase
VLEIPIPDPSLVVLIGAAGSGKSSFAACHFDPDEVLSSDGFRALISGDPANQAVTRAAFGRLHKELARRLAERRLTVVDATNVDRSARRELLRRAAAAGIPSVAIVFDLAAELVLARNAARTSRVVDEGVVQRHLAQLRDELDGPSAAAALEGFAGVTILRSPMEVASARVIRRGVT